jgi:hypothetical protein
MSDNLGTGETAAARADYLVADAVPKNQSAEAKFSDNANPFAVNVPKRRLFALFISLEHSSLQ